MQSNAVIYQNVSFASCGSGNTQSSLFLYTNFIQNITISSSITLPTGSSFGGVAGGFSPLIQIENLQLNISLSSPSLQSSNILTTGTKTLILFNSVIQFAYPNVTSEHPGLLQIVLLKTSIKSLTLKVSIKTNGDGFGLARKLLTNSSITHASLDIQIHAADNTTQILTAGAIGSVENNVTLCNLQASVALDGSLNIAGGLFAYAGQASVSNFTLVNASLSI